MSRGLGKVERELLHEIEINPLERTVVAPFTMDATRCEARRRAARNLDRKGLAVLRRSEAKGIQRSKSILLSAKAAAEWDEREARRDADKARDAKRKAAHEELEARRAIRPDGNASRRVELLVGIKRVSGRPAAADLLLSEIEASLSEAWSLEVLGERNGVAQIRFIYDED